MKKEVKGKIIKNIKMLAVASMISLGALSMVACQKTEPDIKIEKDIQGTGIGEYKGDVEVTPTAPTQIQDNTPKRTVIENGEVKVWAETFDRDKTIKPTSIIYEEKGHKIIYNVDGKEIMVAVNEKTGARYFYEDGKGVDFAQIGSDVTKSNEAVLNSYAANMRLNEEMKKKYK